MSHPVDPPVPRAPGPADGPSPYTSTVALGGLTIATPPIGWIVAAIVVAVVALVVVILLGGTIGWAIFAWAAAGPGAIGLLAGFTISNTRRQAEPLYDDRSPLVPALYWPAVVVAGLGVAVSAWYIADWVGRL